MQSEFYLSIDGNQTGPHTRDDLLALWRQGAISATALYWTEEMVDWLPLDQLFGQIRPAAPPPLPTQPPPIPALKQHPEKKTSGCLIVLIIFASVLAAFFLLILIGISSRSGVGSSTKSTANAESSSPRINGEDGYYASRRFIQNCLKAPSTAKFSNIQTDPNTGWKPEDGDRIRCWGTVDAKNSFGVPLRQVWTTVVQPSGTKWDIVYATLGSETLIDIRDQHKTTKIISAEEFIGKTKEQMIGILGQPKNVERGNHARDGGFSIYKYSDEKGRETFFTIWDSDQRIDNGMYEGTYFYKK